MNPFHVLLFSCQVTCQTKQLTTAFEKQSQHISGLLAELQEKESILLVQGEELQRYKQELDAHKADEEGEEKKRREEMIVEEVEDEEQKEETQDERSVEISGLQSNQISERPVAVLTTNSQADSDAQRGEREIVTSNAERATSIRGDSDNEARRSEEQHPGSQDKTRGSHDSAGLMGETECNEDGGTADMVAELLALQQENLLLKRVIEGMAVPDTRTPALHTDGEQQEDPVKQSQKTGNAYLSCSAEQRSQSVPDDIPTDAQQSLLQDVKTMKNEGDLEMGDYRAPKAKEELEAVSELQINRLHHQVVTACDLFISQQGRDMCYWRRGTQIGC